MRKIIALTFVATCCAADPVTTIPQGAYTVANLTLDTAGEPTSILVGFRDGIASSAALGGTLVVPTLKISGTQLTGRIEVAPPNQAKGNWTISGELKGSVISGTWEGQWLQSFGSKTKNMTGKGTLTGTLVTQEALAASNAVIATASWNSRFGSGIGNLVSPGGPALADHFSKFRLIWRSEELMPGQPGLSGGLSRKVLGVPTSPITGGGASPVVAEGRVVIRYHFPAGTVYDKRALDLLTEKYGKDFAQKDKIKVAADEVILCMDAATGATVWKTVIPVSNLNYQDHKLSVNDLSPAIADGKVFAISPSMVLRCLSLVDGKILWQVELPAANKMAEKLAGALSNAAYMYGGGDSRDYGFHPVIYKDLVLTNSWGADLLAYKSTDGTLAWTAKGVCDKYADPAIWSKDGVDFAIIPNGQAFSAVNLADGSVAWKYPFKLGGFSGQHCIVGDHLVAWTSTELSKGEKAAAEKNALAKDEKPEVKKGEEEDDENGSAELQCLTLTKEAATLAWAYKEKNPGWGVYAQLLVKDRVYVGGRGLVSAIDLASGKVVADAPGNAIGNCGHFFAAGDRLFANADGKHGGIHMAMFDIKDGFRRMSAPDESWSPRMPQSTSYHHWATYPIVDGRMFIRGGDGVYCWDLRAP